MGALLPGRGAPAQPVEHDIQNVDEPKVRQGLVCLTLAPRSKEGAQHEQHLHLIRLW